MPEITSLSIPYLGFALNKGYLPREMVAVFRARFGTTPREIVLPLNFQTVNLGSVEGIPARASRHAKNCIYVGPVPDDQAA